MVTKTEHPFYVKFAFISIGIATSVTALFIGRHILVPLIEATILAILLNPFVNALVKRKVNRTVAIFMAVCVAILTTLALFYLISQQLSLFSDTYPQIKAKFTEKSAQLIQWGSSYFNIKTSAINNRITAIEKDLVADMGGVIGQTITAINSVLIGLVLLPVYLFLLLYYKPMLLEFIQKLCKSENQPVVSDIMASTKKIIQSYLMGLIFEAFIIAALNSAGLFLLGIPYAIILGITGALLNVIPYIGGVIAIALPMIIAFVTKESVTYPILVFIIYLVIQFVDNHLIVPNIVASKVRINALICIVSVILGGTLWGIPGMFLSIPLTAIIKVICDHVDSLKPFGFLLGSIEPASKNGLDFSNIKRKKMK